MAVGSVQILGTGQLLELQRKLRAAGQENLRRNMQRRIRRAAEPLHADLVATVSGLPIRSAGRSAGKRGGPSPTTRPLRATIAGAIRISVRTSGAPGARVWVDKSRLPHDLRNMAQTLNDPSGRVRHPVFGNRRRWANQTVSPSMWWEKTVGKHKPRMQSEVARIVDDVRSQLN
ncbi:hypothetical protein [Streptomyces sp. H27-C3]|uniref:hypothetical protein n=1 Tax=Streptomyces sp. H27-C3 TaxID=3046305 RepID=UPI0024BB7A3C|nr:hypothetical protein [Streptomyces sp. H27-C3]MDJ0461553.1 hypothetical protein [Streptomyces sp. H27-C3]